MKKVLRLIIGALVILFLLFLILEDVMYFETLHNTPKIQNLSLNPKSQSPTLKTRPLYIVDSGLFNNSSLSPFYLFNTIAALFGYKPGRIIMCPLNTTNELNQCVDAEATKLNGPRIIIFNSTGSLAYISNIGNKSITKCQVNATTGKFSTCTITGATGMNHPVGLALNPNNERLVYIVDRVGSVVLCQINTTTGDLSACRNAGAVGLDSPRTITFNKAGTMAYITNVKINSITQCHINPTTGQLTGCTNSGARGLSHPFGFKFNATETFAYIVNEHSDSISQCKVSATTGQLSDCTNSGATPLHSPIDLFLSSTGQAYITTNTMDQTDYQSSALNYAVQYDNKTLSNIILCDIEPNTGQLKPCHLLHRYGTSNEFGIQRSPKIP